MKQDMTLPTGDQLRAIARSARTSASDDASSSELVLAGWEAAIAARSITNDAAPAWNPIDTAKPHDGPFWLFDPALIDADFCPSGVVDGHWQDDEGWMGAVWNGYTDEWDTRVIKPTHWMLPWSPATPHEAATAAHVDHLPGAGEMMAPEAAGKAPASVPSDALISDIVRSALEFHDRLSRITRECDHDDIEVAARKAKEKLSANIRATLAAQPRRSTT